MIRKSEILKKFTDWLRPGIFEASIRSLSGVRRSEPTEPHMNRVLVANYILKALPQFQSRSRLASAATSGTLVRMVKAGLYRQASLDLDMFARASYIEGLTGEPNNTLTKNPRRTFGRLQQALQDGTPNRLLEVMMDEKGMKVSEILKLISMKNQGVFASFLKGIRGSFQGQDAVRGLMPSDVASSLLLGYSPLTGNPMSKLKGRGVFGWLGATSKKAPTLAGINSIAGKSGKQFGLDVARSAPKEEVFVMPLDVPVGEGLALQETVADPASLEDANWQQLTEVLYRDPEVAAMVDAVVRPRMTGKTQKLIWDLVRQDPSVLRFSRNGQVALDARAAVKMLARSGQLDLDTSDPKALRKKEVLFNTEWRKGVKPRMEDALRSSEVADLVMSRADLMEFLTESQRRPGPGGTGQVGPIYPAGEGPEPYRGPTHRQDVMEWDQETFDQQMGKALRQLKKVPGIKKVRKELRQEREQELRRQRMQRDYGETFDRAVSDQHLIDPNYRGHRMAQRIALRHLQKKRDS
jgi:hypothetical protein